MHYHCTFTPHFTISNIFNIMAFKLNIFLSFNIIIFLLPLLYSTTLAKDTDTSTPSICNSTPYPNLCSSSLQTNNHTANVYDYGRFSVRKSLSAAHKFLRLIEKYLHKPSTLTTGAIRALEDCHLLAQLNIDFLSSSSQIVEKTQTLSTLQADDVQTLLSAILTNTQTCLDGLQETASSWRLKNGISTPLSNYDTKLYSVSLALFKKGWVHKKKKGPSSTTSKKHGALQNGHFSLKMSKKNKVIFETVGRRKLLQDTDSEVDQIPVSDMVVVSQDGTGNFTTINDALAVAPNNSVASDGYFLIYVTAGVYEEYVIVNKKKKYVMIMGDGINQTIITGNRSVVDGWTTFNSSTFGKKLINNTSLFRLYISPY